MPAPAPNYDDIFAAAGAEWNVDPNFLKAVALQESNLNRHSVSSANAQGIMQIIPSTQRALGVTDPFDPEQSIYGGAKYLSQALDAERTPEDALRWYHGGPGWRGNYGQESRDYAPAVTGRYRTIMAAGGIGGTATPAPPAAPSTPATAPQGTPKPVPAAAPKQAAPAADPLDDFLTGKTDTHAAPSATPATQAKPGTPPPLDDVDKFLTGADAPAPPPPPPAPPAPGQIATKTATGAPGPTYSGDVDTPLPGPNTGLNALPPPSRAITAATAALEPTPGTTYGNILPFAVDDKTGERRLALPNALREPALSVLHLLQSPSTGALTPEDTMTLLAGAAPNPLARAADLPGVAGANLLPRWKPEGFRYVMPDKPTPTGNALQLGADGKPLPPAAPPRPSGWDAPPERVETAKPNALQLGPDGKPVQTGAPTAAPAGPQPGMGGPQPGMGGPVDPHAGTVTTSAGRKVGVRYEVVSADDLTAASGDLQPRDRAGRLASEAQIQDIATKLDPARLMRAAEADRGAPIVGPDGIIESGNGRVQGINRAQQLNPKGHAAYVKALSDAGYDVEGINNPVLVAKRTTDLSPEDRQAFVKEANVSSTARLSPSEQAGVDGQAITSDMLERYDPSKEPTSAANRDFVRGWVGTLPEAERNAVVDAGGELSAEGVRRLGGAMLSKAYGDKGILARGLESTDDNIRSISGAMAGAAPAWARLRGAVEKGTVPKAFDVSQNLADAADLVRVAREKGHGLNDILNQQDAFNPIDPVTAGFVRSFYNADGTRAASRASIIDTLQRYADEAQKQGAGPSMFGDTVTPQQALDAVLTRRAPVPESAGAAATPAHLTGIERAWDLAYRSVSERSKLNETQPAGPDRMIHIEGVHPTTAEAEQSVALAREQKALGIRSPEVSQEARDIATANNERRQTFLQNEIIPSKVQLVRQKEITRAQIENDKGAAFDNRTPVKKAEMQKVADTVTAKLTDLQGAENSQLQHYIGPIADRLKDNTGKFKDDPLQLYGLRQDLNRMRSKESQAHDTNLLHVAGELGDIIEVLDGAIESGAPGYRGYMQNTAANLQREDAMEALRSHESSFYDAQNRIQHSRVQSVMKKIVEARDLPSNIQDGHKHIPQDILDKLWALRDDTRRVATAKELASTPGSDTAQNTWDTVKGLAGGIAGNTAAHAVANATMGPLGSAAVNIGKAALSSMRQGKQAKTDLARGMHLLHPDPRTLKHPLDPNRAP